MDSMALIERRRFLTRCGLGSLSLGMALPHVAALGADEAGTKVPRAEATRRPGCRITVLKRTLTKEYLDQFRNGVGEACPVFREGQEFVLAEPFGRPEGVFVACCSDGFRPVFFKIERATSLPGRGLG